MTFVWILGELIVGFIIGTLVLWGCSFTVKTPNANLKTAAIYNAIMTVLGGVLLAIGLLFVQTESGVAGVMFFVSLILTLIVSFWLLMTMYEIGFLAALWLVIAMWAVDTGIEKLMDVIA